MSDPLPSYAGLLSEVAEIFSVLVDPAAGPAPGSPAERELATARDHDAGTGPWGEEPIRTAYALAALNYNAALDQARAMTALMTGAFTAVPTMVLGRSLIEATSRAWWLLEPGIGAIARVERYQAARYAGAVEGERAMLADGVPEEEVGLYTETPSQVGEYSRKLGLAAPMNKGHVYVCGDQRLPSPWRRVVDMFEEIDVPGAYNYYSGFSHGEHYALQHAFEETIGLDGHHFYLPVVNEEAIKGAVAMASWALYPPAARVTTLFGLGQSDLEEWVEKQETVNPGDQEMGAHGSSRAKVAGPAGYGRHHPALRPAPVLSTESRSSRPWSCSPTGALDAGRPSCPGPPSPSAPPPA